MITKFDSLYAGHVDMDDMGYGGTAVNSRVFPNEHLVTAYAKARNLARLLDRFGYDTFWLAEHHFQREGYECIPNVLLLALDLAHQTERLKIGLRLQHHADVASPPAGRGLRHGGRAHRRPGALRGRPRLPHARGAYLRSPAARSTGQPRALRGAGRDHLQGVQQRRVLPRGQALHHSRPSPVSGLRFEGPHPGAAARSPRGMLAAYPERDPARHGL